jgi:hypothetical protein
MGNTCITPCTLMFGRKDEFNVTISKPGYQPQSVPVGTRLAGAGAADLAGNVLFGGIIEVGVDAYNGAQLEHFPNPVSAQLMPLRLRPEPTPLRAKSQNPQYQIDNRASRKAKASGELPAPPMLHPQFSMIFRRRV